MNTFLKSFAFSCLVLTSAILFSAIIAPAPVQAMNACGNPASSTIILPQDSNVTVRIIAPGDPTTVLNNLISLSSPRQITLGRGKTNIGSQYALGQFSAGTELVFSIDNTEGDIFYTGPASRNPEDLVHAKITQNSTNEWTVKFEDQGGGGDCNYDNANFIVTATAACTTHASKQCSGNAVYWYNSCSAKEDIFQQCSGNQTCQNGQCVTNNDNNDQCSNENLVKNPSMEESNIYTADQCASTQTGFSNAYVKDWYGAYTGVGGSYPDTYHFAEYIDRRCAQPPKLPYFLESKVSDVASDGNRFQGGWLGIGPPYADEYFQGSIKEPLVVGETYEISLDISGVDFTSNQVTATSHVNSVGKTATVQIEPSENRLVYPGNFGVIIPSTSNVITMPSVVLQRDNYQRITKRFVATNSARYFVVGAFQGMNQPAVYVLTDNYSIKKICRSVCDRNTDCGTNSYIGSPHCGLTGDVYQTYRTYICNNPGTAQSSCSHSDNSQLKQNCTANQTCQNGQCVNFNIACSSNAQCGTNAYTGSPFCQGNSVYQNYITYICHNPGAGSSYCSNSTAAQKKNDCASNQVCANGSCSNQNIACSSNTECGTNAYTGSPFCQGNNVYQNYITYTCNNAGTSSSYCSNSTAAKLKQSCTANQTCANGSCSNQDIACSSNTDCGTNAYTGSPFCQGNNVYQNYITYTCNSAGTASSYCSNATAAKLKQSCASGQTCANGSCSANCNSHSYQQCQGSYLYWYDSCGNQQDSQYCPNGCFGNSCQNNTNLSVQTNPATNVLNNQATLNGYLYISNNNNNNCSTYVWFQYGPSSSYGSETSHQLQNNSGAFSQNITNMNSGSTYHFRAAAQSCSGNIVYGQDMTTYSSTTGGNLTVSKTVRNLTNGSSWANSVSAAPSDMLMFMITLQATGSQDVQNVIARDYLSANLIYNNQLVVACTTNNSNYNNCNGSNYNYTGNISSGINLNTIYAGQTVTITYQTQVASAQNFSYGTTTLNNNVSVTSTNGTNPTSAASVFVTRSAVYGASVISTGLTNNFWIDSFFLPLMIVLLALWMWKSGMFFGIEKWLDNRRKIRKGYKTEKELKNRIAIIQRAEKI